jgi:hypothetical protein
MTITAMTSITSNNVDAKSQGFGDTQPGRVGNHDNAAQTSGEGAQGGTVTDPTISGDPTYMIQPIPSKRIASAR